MDFQEIPHSLLISLKIWGFVHAENVTREQKRLGGFTFQNQLCPNVK